MYVRKCSVSGQKKKGLSEVPPIIIYRELSFTKALFLGDESLHKWPILSLTLVTNALR